MSTTKVEGTDLYRKNLPEEVGMCTVLQPAEMLKGEILLHEAARKDDVTKIKELVARKVNVNVRNNLDRTALQWAAANGNNQSVEALLNSGADVEAQDKYGMRALLWAAWFGHTEVMKTLVNSGAHIICTNRQGLNMLHCAAQNNHVGVLQFICDNLENYKMNDIDKNEKTALHLAAEKGHMDTVEKLITMKCDVHIKDKGGQSPLHLAANSGYTEVLKRLLMAGVEVDDRDMDGRTALHLASEHGHSDCVYVLLDNKADCNAETTKEMTSLHLAAQNGHTDVIAALIEHGCHLNSQNYQGNTALHLAAINNHPPILDRLIDARCQLDLTNQRLQTPLHAAVEKGFDESVEVLLVAGADLQAKEKSGKSALGLASRGSFIGIVDMIIKADRHKDSPNDDDDPDGVSIMRCGRYHHCFYSATCNATWSQNQNHVEHNSIQLKHTGYDGAEYMKDILWKLAHKQLRASEWKKLAFHWKFTELHVKAIEHQYTGPNSYREHAYRLLLIWMHGIRRGENAMKLLYEALVEINRKELADQIRRKANLQLEKNNSGKYCLIS